MMVDRLVTVAALVAALGAGVIGGVFFAFSAFVMRALARLPMPAGVAAMQAINVVVLNATFLGAFMGTAALGVVAMVAAIVRWERPGAGWMLAGGALYLAGTFGVTIAFNVPLNEALAKVTPADADAEQRWSDYLKRWTAWNHVRTIAAVAAAGAFMMALRG